VTRAVLLVDDDEDLRTSLQQFLSEEGFVVHTARDGGEALTILRAIEPPGLILLDLMMPGMNGKQFLVERGGDSALARIPVVIMSAWTREWRGETVGADDVVTKPVKPEQLLALVERYCDRERSGDAQRR
jgi:DNA-binding response OmpR family regulator